jgi:hypothetical protein
MFCLVFFVQYSNSELAVGGIGLEMGGKEVVFLSDGFCPSWVLLLAGGPDLKSCCWIRTAGS